MTVPQPGPASSCHDKRPYTSEAAALKRLRLYRLNKRLRRAGQTRTLHVYPCPWCERWHIGHAIGSKEVF